MHFSERQFLFEFFLRIILSIHCIKVCEIDSNERTTFFIIVHSFLLIWDMDNFCYMYLTESVPCNFESVFLNFDNDFVLFLCCWWESNLIVFVGGYETKFIGDLTEVDEVEIRRIESTWYDESFSKFKPYFYLPM